MDIIENKAIVAEQYLFDAATNTHRSIRALAKMTGVHRDTVSKVCAKVDGNPEAFLGIGSMARAELEQLFSESSKHQDCKEPIDAKHWISVCKKSLIDRRQAHELYCKTAKRPAYSYSFFCEVLSKEMGKKPATMLLDHKPDEAQVDFAGRKAWLKRPEDNKNYQCELFVATLAHSTLFYMRACYTQSIEDWIACHKAWFQFLGGVPQLIICDNLKSAVIKGGKNFVLNRTYQEFSRHNNFKAKPARPWHPQDKAMVEGEVNRAAYWVMSKLKGKVFFSAEQLNAAIEPLVHEYNQRAFAELEGSRESWFVEVDSKYLRPLPVVEYDPPVVRRNQAVKASYHIKYNKHKYSVPYTLIGEKLDIRVTQSHIACYHKGERVAEHLLSNDVGGKTTAAEHMKPEHAYYQSLGREEMIEWAGSIGPNAKTLIAAQFESRTNQFHNVEINCGEFRKLARNVGDEQFEQLAELALQRSCHSFDVCKAIVDNRGLVS